MHETIETDYDFFNTSTPRLQKNKPRSWLKIKESALVLLNQESCLNMIF